MNLQENISTQLRRRIHMLDRSINNLLPNMYPCDYNSSDGFIEGVLDEIRWFLVDSEEFEGIERIDIQNYILDYKYDELTDYFNEHCIVLKKDYIQEQISRIQSMMGVISESKKLDKYLISGKKFKEKYAIDFEGKVAKVLYTKNLGLGSNLGKGSYWNVTQDSLDIYSGKRDKEFDARYGEYVKDIIYKEIDDNLRIFVKDEIADELWDNEKLYNKIKKISDGIYDPVFDDYGLVLF